MTKPKILAVGLGMSVTSLLCGCANEDITHSITTPTDTIETTENTTVSTETTEQKINIDDIEYIYCDNDGVVHNIWELSYHAERKPSYIFEYRQSSTTVTTYEVDKATGDEIFNLFLNLNVKDYTTPPQTGDIRLKPSTVTYKLNNTDTEQACYPPAEIYSAILDRLLDISNQETTTT